MRAPPILDSVKRNSVLQGAFVSSFQIRVLRNLQKRPKAKISLKVICYRHSTRVRILRTRGALIRAATGQGGNAAWTERENVGAMWPLRTNAFGYDAAALRAVQARSLLFKGVSGQCSRACSLGEGGMSSARATSRARNLPYSDATFPSCTSCASSLLARCFRGRRVTGGTASRRRLRIGKSSWRRVCRRRRAAQHRQTPRSPVAGPRGPHPHKMLLRCRLPRVRQIGACR